MDLAEAGGGRGFLAEFGEFALPVGAQFGAHAAADEIPAHRGGVGLELGEFGRVFRRQRVRYGGEELRDLHERAFEPAQDGFQILGMRAAIGFDAEHFGAGDAGGDAADGARGAGHAAQFAEHRGPGRRGRRKLSHAHPIPARR